MKQLHRPDLFGWSAFDEERNLDFHAVLWVRPVGNVIIDPLPLSKHDARHLRKLGGVAMIVVTNADHIRISEALAIETGAELIASAAEQDAIPFECDRLVHDGEEIVPGLRAIGMAGSKTPGEIALLLDGSTLITGDLVRSHAGGRLDLLPDARLADRDAAIATVRRLADLTDITAVLVGDGWPVFRHGGALLRELAERLVPGPAATTAAPNATSC
jgi:hypothetical protein